MNSFTKAEKLNPANYVVFALLTLIVFVICVATGSVNIPFGETINILWNALTGQPQQDGTAVPIILSSRLPRVMCVALVGASLSIGGAAMQGLLKNPLADGSTLGVSSGASTGAILAMVLGINIPGLPFAGTMVMAILFAFLSLIIILSLAYRLDYTLSTNTIILLGIIFSMFMGSINALLTTFAGEGVRGIVFWLMGSLAGSTYTMAAVLAVATIICGGILLCCARELNAFAIGEDNARHIGVNVRRVRIIVLISVSALIGICVSASGMIGFVGLVTPHMVRMLVGPNHKRLLPATLFGGALFLMLADLLARTILSPRELPIGVVTSLIGAVVFLFIFFKMRKGK
jgi:ABC-type Fe3+-siderophore transport system, permease component